MLPRRNADFSDIFLIILNSAMGKGHENLVRYFCSWVESDRVHIQMEYCNGGTLEDYLNTVQSNNEIMPTWYIKQILTETATGLNYIEYT